MASDKRYGVWAGNPKGIAEDPAYCIKEIFPPERGAMHRQCSNRRGFGPDKAYCKKHDPEAIAAKLAKEAQERDEHEARQLRIEARAKTLTRKLGVRGDVDFNSRSGNYVERLVITFTAAEKLIERLQKK